MNEAGSKPVIFSIFRSSHNFTARDECARLILTEDRRWAKQRDQTLSKDHLCWYVTISTSPLCLKDEPCALTYQQMYCCLNVVSDQF